jgi:hypothetical protein
VLLRVKQGSGFVGPAGRLIGKFSPSLGDFDSLLSSLGPLGPSVGNVAISMGLR